MTANQLIRQLQRGVNKLNTGDVEVLFEGQPFFVNAELAERGDFYCINLIDILS